MPKPSIQEDAIAFLADPASYGPAVERVEVIETHISLVFLAGDRAYKLKRAIKYPYLDFSTAANRHRACAAELTLNRRTAPELYLGLRAIGRGPDGRIGWAEAGPAIDWVVAMRRFDQELLFDALAQRGGIAPRMMLDLVAHVAAFHAQAERRPDFGGAAAMAAIERENHDCLRQAEARFFAAADITELHARTSELVERHAALLDARRTAGKVRRCHGDLHLRNICLWDGKPVLFDCLEFSEPLATIDVLYDFAFLLMDLEHRGLRELANLAANRYLDLTDEDDGLAALPLFLSLRAAIRAHVTATEVARETMEAGRYLDLARAVLSPQPCRLIAIGGLSGSGKSTIAARLAPTMGALPGARILRSDVIRKRLCGAMPETRLPEAAYAPEMTRRVYETIRTKAAQALRAGYCAIVDAVSLRAEERRSVAEVAARAGVPFSGLWLTAPAKVMEARLGARRDDASDASAEILHRQLTQDAGVIEWPRIDVGADRDVSSAAVRCALGLD